MGTSPAETAKNLFVRRWGEMAASWGVGRTMAEIHALLFISTGPLCTDDIMEQLQVSRGSASTNLRELVNWALISRVHRRGDRKEYFEAERNVWQMFDTIIRERRRREIQPIVETLERCLLLLDDDTNHRRGGNEAAKAYRTRFRDILEFCETMNTMFDLIRKAGQTGVRPLARTIEKLTRK